MGSDIERRLSKAPPFDLMGRYYDELTPDEKKRYWEYTYGGVYTVEQAEAIEKYFISGTLHFECEPRLSDIELPFLDEWEAGLQELALPDLTT